MKAINLYLIEFSLGSLLRQKTKNIFIFTLFSLLIFLVSSIFQISNGLKKEVLSNIETMPQITIHNMQMGRITTIREDIIDDLLQIKGINSANARVWGYYYFAPKDLYFTLIGIDQFEEQYKKSFDQLTQKYDFDTLSDGMVVGSGVKTILGESYYKEYFNFIKPDGKIKKVNIVGEFGRDTTLQTNDLMIVSKELAHEIFGLDESLATDIVVNIENPEEIDTIVAKLKVLYPNYKITTQDDLKRGYEEMFNYKGGVFLALFIVVLFSFFMIVYDKSSGLNSEEKKEIGILKALGWSTNDILKWKFYEGLIISLSSYITGFFLSFLYIYIFKAPLIKDLFLGFSELKPDFNIAFSLDLSLMVIVFFICIPIYIAATIFPSWRASVSEADEVLR